MKKSFESQKNIYEISAFKTKNEICLEVHGSRYLNLKGLSNFENYILMQTITNDLSDTPQF